MTRYTTFSYIIAYFNVGPLKMHLDKCSWVYDIDRWPMSDHDCILLNHVEQSLY